MTLTIAAPAWGDDGRTVLDAPAPPTLPALAHSKLTYTFEVTGAEIDPSPKGSSIFVLPELSSKRAYAWFLHNEVEAPLIKRKVFIGGAQDFVAGSVPGVGHDFFFGSPEVWARALWSSLLGMSAGGGLGIVFPAPRTPSLTQEKIFDTVRVVRPWDAAYFTDWTLTLRPFVDVRHQTHHFTFQLRQGLDISFVLRDLRPAERRIDYAARTTFYIGYRAAESIGVGLEIWELYLITANVSDDKRAAVAMSPSIRFMLGRIEPALSILFPIATPLRGDAVSFLAARLNVGLDFDLNRVLGKEHEQER